MTFAEALRRDVEVSDEEASKLEIHYRYLEKWNRAINLTSVMGIPRAVRKHYAESVYFARCLPPNLQTIADAGSGAGFPGLPIAVILPRVAVTLIESDVRKCAFLRESAAHLPNVHVLNSRLERVVERFDAVVSRAVAPDEVVRARLARQVWMLLSLLQRSTWNIHSILPWDSKSAVAFHVEPLIP